MTATIGAYVLVDAQGVALYVGCSGDVAKRVRQHRSRDWWSDVDDIEVHTCDDHAEAYALETRLIAERKPLHNVYRKSSKPERRKRLTPPHVSVAGVRKVLGLSLVQACALVEQRSRHSLTPAELLAIEGGSGDFTPSQLWGLEAAYDLPTGSLLTGFAPYYRRSA